MHKAVLQQVLSIPLVIEYESADILSEENIKVFPNPNSGIFFVQFDDGQAVHQLELINNLGAVVFRKETQKDVQRVACKLLAFRCLFTSSLKCYYKYYFPTNNYKITGVMKYLSSILILFIVGITTCTNAQNRSFNVGVQTGSIYDIGTGVIGQSNGVADVDLKGWKGDYAKFDLGYGLAASLDIKTRFALDFDILFGQITGQSEEQYYKSSLGMYTMGFRTYFRPHANASRLNAYVSLGIGMTSYDAKTILCYWMMVCLTRPKVLASIIQSKWAR